MEALESKASGATRASVIDYVITNAKAIEEQ